MSYRLARTPRRLLLGPLTAVAFALMASCGAGECDPSDPLCDAGGGGGGGGGGSVPDVSIADVTVTEGHQGTVSAVFAVTLSASSTDAVTVAYATSDGTAAAPDDYDATTGTLTFNAGTTTRDITVPVRGDLLDEGTSETFTVTLSSPSSATIADGVATGTITDDDDCPTFGPMVVGTGASGTLAAGDCQLQVGHYVDNWGLDISSQATVQIDLTSAEFDAYLALVDGAQQLVAEDDDGGVDLDARIVATLDPGSYRILATSFDVGETGDYQLSVDAPSALTISNFDVSLVEVASPQCVTGGSAYNFGFDYNDPSGQVSPGSSFVEFDWEFSPSLNGDFTSPMAVFTGTPTAGSVSWGFCFFFGTDTSVTVWAYLENDVGEFSNELTTVLQKPLGAPVGPTPSAGPPERDASREAR